MDLLSLADAAKRFPSIKNPMHPVSPQSVKRWIVRGAWCGPGKRVYLQATRTPRGWFTSDPWIDEFLEALAHARARLKTGRNNEIDDVPGTPDDR